jgi:hypothetical protein
VDKLLILHAGRIVYFGCAIEAVPYFAKLHYHCPKFFNPVDFFIDIVNDRLKPKHLDMGKKENGEDRDLSEFLAAENEKSEHYEATKKVIEAHREKVHAPLLKAQRKYLVNGFFQFLFAAMRNVLNLVRDPRTSLAQVGQTRMILFIYYYYFWNLSPL